MSSRTLSTETISTSSIRSRPSPSPRRNNTESKEGRTYLEAATSSVPYPLPIDLAETHRQIIFAQLTSMIYTTPILSKDLLANPPLRVLELGCDTGWWSASCHQYFDARGHRVEFVGMDIKAPTAGLDGYYAQMGMDWEYVQHDLNEAPWPLATASFDLVMARNLALALDPRAYSKTVMEYMRVLKPGGILEAWEHDYNIRSMRPRIQERSAEEGLEELGLYPVCDNGDFGPAANSYAAQLNSWITAGFAAMLMPPMPCSYLQAMFGGHLVEGTEDLDITHVKRVAIPLNLEATRWEKTKDGTPRVLNGDQAVVRRTALESFITMVDALEPLIRAASGQSQAGWDAWLNKAKRNWLEEGGLAFGECLEMGAWSVKKSI